MHKVEELKDWLSQRRGSDYVHVYVCVYVFVYVYVSVDVYVYMNVYLHVHVYVLGGMFPLWSLICWHLGFSCALLFTILCSALQHIVLSTLSALLWLPADLSPLMSPLPLSPTISISVSNFVIICVDSLIAIVYFWWSLLQRSKISNREKTALQFQFDLKCA